MNYKELKTDKERLDAMYSIPYTNWQIVSKWADEAENEENRRRFHDRAVSMYHFEEDTIGML